MSKHETILIAFDEGRDFPGFQGSIIKAHNYTSKREFLAVVRDYAKGMWEVHKSGGVEQAPPTQGLSAEAELPRQEDQGGEWIVSDETA